MSCIKVSKSHAMSSHSIYIGGFNSRVTVAAQITVTLIISHNKNEIGLFSFCSRGDHDIVFQSFLFALFPQFFPFLPIQLFCRRARRGIGCIADDFKTFFGGVVVFYLGSTRTRLVGVLPPADL